MSLHHWLLLVWSTSIFTMYVCVHRIVSESNTLNQKPDTECVCVAVTLWIDIH